MMKKSLLLILVVAVLTLCGCQGSNEIGKIDVEAAQQVALNALGIDGAEIHAVSVILCEQDGISYYDVDITVDGVAYEFAVDAVTGVIIEQSQGIAENTDVAVTEDTTAEPAQTEPSENGISAEEAVEIAVRHAGFTRAHVRVATCNLDTGELVSDLPSHTRAKYTVTFYDASVNYYYYIVDAQSGEVLYHFTYSRSTSSSQGIQPREEDEIDPEMNVYPLPSPAGEDIVDIVWGESMQNIPPDSTESTMIELIPMDVPYPILDFKQTDLVPGIFKDTTLLEQITAHSGYSRMEIKVIAKLICRAGTENAFYVYFSTPDGKYFRYVISRRTSEILSWESADSLNGLKHPLRDSANEVIIPDGSVSIEEAYGYALKSYIRYDSVLGKEETIWADDVILYVAEPDCSDGEYEYDFIFQNKQSGWFHTVTVRASDGAIRYAGHGAWSKGYFGGFEHVAAVKMTVAEAKELVLSYIPGATETNITAFFVNTADGKMEYNGTVTYLGVKFEFSIDAYSGSFRTWNAEPIA